MTVPILNISNMQQYLYTVPLAFCFKCSISTPATNEEYKLLQQLNQITLAKYTDMCAIAHRLNEVSSRVNDNCKCICLFVCMYQLVCDTFHFQSCVIKTGGL